MTKKGTIKNSIEGQEGYNNFGSKMIVIKDRGAKDIDVYFPEYNWTFEHASRSNFNRGLMLCPYEPRYYGKGYLGEGKYKAVDENGKQTKCSKAWMRMLERCYSEKWHNAHPAYKGCEVCSEWYNFQNFAKWYYENYYEIENQRMSLDKDILIKGNKIYSPETCIFAPQRINTLFVKAENIRGEYPIGIHYHIRDDVLEVQCSIYEDGIKKVKYLGRFMPNQVNEAFLCYKKFKESYIKQVADEYKDLIPEKLYDAMYRYEVDIND